MCMSKNICLGLLALLASATVAAAPASAQQQKPNISAYNRGMMGYRTPNIDRIANEGAILTDYYGQQSCTAGRAAFITGQSPMRTGLLKVGLPGAKEGLSEKDPNLSSIRLRLPPMHVPVPALVSIGSLQCRIQPRDPCL
jgi:hypothetical protein